MSFCFLILDLSVSGIDILATAKAAGADMKDADTRCSAGICMKTKKMMASV